MFGRFQMLELEVRLRDLRCWVAEIGVDAYSAGEELLEAFSGGWGWEGLRSGLCRPLPGLGEMGRGPLVCASG